jgi:hypothetical protein
MHPHAAAPKVEMQVGPGLHVPVQSSQAPPVLPHWLSELPGWHMAPSQQPPLQGEPGSEHALPQVLPTQACPAPQSLAVLQSTHLPPDEHTFEPGHMRHSMPPWPQAAEVVPGAHVVRAQHPPLQS